MRLLTCVMFLLLVGFLSSIAPPFSAHSQDLLLPAEPIAPTRMAQCQNLYLEFQSLIRETNQQFDNCHKPRWKEPWGGVYGRGGCANWGVKSCYGIIEACDAIQDSGAAAVARCRQKVLAHLEAKKAAKQEARDAERAKQKIAFDAYENVADKYNQLRRAQRYIENPGDAISRSLNKYLGRELISHLRKETPPGPVDSLSKQQYDWVRRLTDTLGKSVHRSPITRAIHSSALSELSQHHSDILRNLYQLAGSIDSFGVDTGQPDLASSLPSHFRTTTNIGSTYDRNGLAARLEELFGSVDPGDDPGTSAVDPYEACAHLSAAEFNVCVDEVVRGTR